MSGYSHYAASDSLLNLSSIAATDHPSTSSWAAPSQQQFYDFNAPTFSMMPPSNNSALPPFHSFFGQNDADQSLSDCSMSHSFRPIDNLMPAHIAELLKAPANYYLSSSFHNNFEAVSSLVNQFSLTYLTNDHATDNGLCHQTTQKTTELPSSTTVHASLLFDQYDGPLASRSELEAAINLASLGLSAENFTAANQCNKAFGSESVAAVVDIGDNGRDEFNLTGYPGISDDANSSSAFYQSVGSDQSRRRGRQLKKENKVQPHHRKSRSTANHLRELLEQQPCDETTMLLNHFCSTSRDYPLVEVLREYGEHITIKWIKVLSQSGNVVHLRPVCFTCHVAECRLSTEHSEEIVKHMRTSFDCNQCPRRFHTQRQLDIHIQASHTADTGNKLYLCDACGFSFKSRAALVYHKQAAHFICSVCTFGASDSDDLTNHLASRHNNHSLHFPCENCGHRFLSQFLLTNHQLEEHPSQVSNHPTDSKQRSQCHVCGKFLTPSALRVHLKRKHDQEKRFKCNYCTYESFDNFQMREHMRRHLGEYKYKCEHCDFTCVKKYQLDSHSRIHTRIRPFCCQECNFAACWNVQLKNHREAHRLDVPIVCKACDIFFRDDRGLGKHIKEVHLKNANASSQPVVKRKKPKFTVRLVKKAVDTAFDSGVQTRARRQQALSMKQVSPTESSVTFNYKSPMARVNDNLSSHIAKMPVTSNLNENMYPASTTFGCIDLSSEDCFVLEPQFL